MVLLFLLDKSRAAYSVNCSSELSGGGGGGLSFFLELPLSRGVGEGSLQAASIAGCYYKKDCWQA